MAKIKNTRRLNDFFGGISVPALSKPTQKVISQLDTTDAVNLPFTSFAQYPSGPGVDLCPVKARDYIQVKIGYNKEDEIDVGTNDFDNCEEVVKNLALTEKIKKIICCRIKSFVHWKKNMPYPLCIDTFYGIRNAIVVVLQNGKGYLCIANKYGKFA